MEKEIMEKLAEQEARLILIHTSIEKMRKYFLWTLIITIGMVVLPLIGLIAIVPWFLNIIGNAYSL